MAPVYMLVAIPLFFVFIGLEWLWARRVGRRVYRLNDAVSDLGCGITQQLFVRFFQASLLLAYAWVYEHWRLVTLPEGPLPWVVGLLGVDLAYYWWHRLSHEVNALWAVHVVHHQSEDYNLAVALRQAPLSSLTIFPFYVTLAFLGVPPLHYAVAAGVGLLYQFWIHTELVGKLGAAEEVLNTPSHHRVHHAVNPQYLDRNYGAVLIVWDRLFGTLEREVEPPVYGLTQPLRSFNPLWAQVHSWVELLRRSLRAPSLGDALRVWVASPADKPSWLPLVPGAAPRGAGSQEKYDPPAEGRTRAYVLLHFTLGLLASVALLGFGTRLSLGAAVAATGLVLLGLATLSALLEGKRWALPVELARWGLTASFLLWLTWGTPLLTAVAAGILLAAPSLLLLRRRAAGVAGTVGSAA